MPLFRPMFLIKIVSAVFEIFRKNGAKKKKQHFFHAGLQAKLDHHNLYGKVKYDILIHHVF